MYVWTIIRQLQMLFITNGKSTHTHTNKKIKQNTILLTDMKMKTDKN